MSIFRFLQKLICQSLDVNTNPLDLMPEFVSIEYEYGNINVTNIDFALDKLRECERRLVYFKWVESKNEPGQPKHRIILDDALSAFLLSYEATLQYIKYKFNQNRIDPNFDNWIKNQPENDILLKGLRTLRHLEAHVEHKPTPSLVKVKVGSGFVERIWRLPLLTKEDIEKLKYPKINSAECEDWKSLVNSNSVDDLLEKSLHNLKKILLSANNIVSINQDRR